MKTVIDMVKSGLKVLPFYLFTLLPLFTSCSEAEEEDLEYADWQNRNEAYFESQYQAYSVQSATKFVLPSWGQASSKSVSEVAHTNCVLVDVIESGEGPASQTSPYYTDSVAVNYSGRLMPTTRYPSGYEFDRTYLTTFDPDVDVPSQFAVNGVVEGFATALQHMHRGDTWRVTVPYQLGYGPADRTTIPAYSTRVFEVQLVDFWSKKKGDRD